MMFWNKPKCNCDEKDETIRLVNIRNEQLRAEVKELKEVKFQLKIAKMYIDDDPALLELFELAKKKEQRAPEPIPQPREFTHSREMGLLFRQQSMEAMGRAAAERGLSGQQQSMAALGQACSPQGLNPLTSFLVGQSMGRML